MTQPTAPEAIGLLRLLLESLEQQVAQLRQEAADISNDPLVALAVASAQTGLAAARRDYGTMVSLPAEQQPPRATEDLGDHLLALLSSVAEQRRLVASQPRPLPEEPPTDEPQATQAPGEPEPDLARIRVRLRQSEPEIPFAAAQAEEGSTGRGPLAWSLLAAAVISGILVLLLAEPLVMSFLPGLSVATIADSLSSTGPPGGSLVVSQPATAANTQPGDWVLQTAPSGGADRTETSNTNNTASPGRQRVVLAVPQVGRIAQALESPVARALLLLGLAASILALLVRPLEAGRQSPEADP